jgi:probable F420-dependent oxidoreductase
MALTLPGAESDRVTVVEFGLAIFPTEEVPSPPELGRLAEERGFESLLFPEHTHIPASRESPWPVGGELPRQYSRTYDPFVALTAAAAATERLRIGTGICLVIERDPIITAKEVASLDRLSGGRFLFGVGAGWNAEEMRNHGTEFGGRFRLMRERIEAMKAIWSEDEASFAGEHVSFERIWCWPKPLQQPHPPILIGGEGPHVLDRVLAYGDEWMPNLRPRRPPSLPRASDDELITRFAELQARARQAGRPPVPMTAVGMTADQARIERYERAGVHRCVFWLPADGADQVERAADRYAATVQEHRRAGG